MKNVFKVGNPVFVQTKDRDLSGMKKTIDSITKICNHPIDVVGRIAYIDEEKVILDDSGHFMSVMYEIPIRNIETIGYTSRC